MAADTKARVEDIYLPYKTKRRTKAQIAREAGLEPLADRLLADPTLDPEETATEFLGDAVSDACRGARGSQIHSHRARGGGRRTRRCRPRQVLDGRISADGASVGWSRQKSCSAKFRDYFEFSEPLETMPSHRVLAVMRGEKEQVLALNLDGGGEEIYQAMVAKTLGVDLSSTAAATPWLATTVRLAWLVKLMVSAAVDARMRLRQRAEEDAVGGGSPGTSRTSCSRRRRARALRSAWIPASGPASRSPWWTPPARWSIPARSSRISHRSNGTRRRPLWAP